jgi:alkylation response protein AidB-like acyl-CoA dehydrogenase
VDLSTSDTREALQASVRAFLTDRSSTAKVMSDMESQLGYDPQLWREFMTLVGLDGSFRDVAVVLEELGAAVACLPFLSTAVLAARALTASRADHPAASDHLTAIAAGELIATVALGADGACTAVRQGPGWTVSGELPLVLDGNAAGLLLLPADADGEPALVAVRPGERVHREALLTMDRTRRLSAITLNGAPADVVSRGSNAGALLRDLRLLACVALACEAVGGGQRCLEMSTEYARTRKQFGQPIGTFQAIKHTCANMLVSLELARSTAAYAAWCVDENPDDLPVAAPMAKSLCAQTYRTIAADTIQVHGGIGFTWDHPAHLYYKRAKSTELFMGQPAAHRQELAEALGL